MIIEEGDFFAISNFEKKEPVGTIAGCLVLANSSVKTLNNVHNGNIYLAVAVCGNMVAARCVKSTSNTLDEGKMFSIDISILDVWPLSKKYIEAFGIKDVKLDLNK